MTGRVIMVQEARFVLRTAVGNCGLFQLATNAKTDPGDLHRVLNSGTPVTVEYRHGTGATAHHAYRLYLGCA